MPDILAIVSKGVFEKDAQQGKRRLGLGDTLPTDRYLSTNRGLEPLRAGGRLVLVTVRPPDEQLWLVAILDELTFSGSAWIAASPNRTPLTDISHLRATIRFESGKGMSQDKGALGMSLQTPRALAAADMEQIVAALGGAGGGAAAPAPARPSVSDEARALLDALAKSPRDEALRERAARRLMTEDAWGEATKVLAGLAHLNAHDPSGLPCLCRACLAPGLAETESGGMTFARDFVVEAGKMLFFWAPKELSVEATKLRNSVRGSLAARVALLEKSRKRQARTPF